MADPPPKRRARTLPELVQSLPQELYDQIYDETFTWTRSDKITTINDPDDFDHPPTSLLRVNRDIRSRLLHEFFYDRRFLFPSQLPEDELFQEFATSRLAFEAQQPSHLQFELMQGITTEDFTKPLYPFVVALKLKGLSTGMEIEELPETPFSIFVRKRVKLYCWGM